MAAYRHWKLIAVAAVAALTSLAFQNCAGDMNMATYRKAVDNSSTTVIPTYLNPTENVIGHIDSGTELGQIVSATGWVLWGWACVPGLSDGIRLKLYVRISSNNQDSVFIQDVVTDDGNGSTTDAGVFAACSTTSGTHRFNVPLSRDTQIAYAGKTYYFAYYDDLTKAPISGAIFAWNDIAQVPAPL